MIRMVHFEPAETAGFLIVEMGSRPPSMKPLNYLVADADICCF